MNEAANEIERLRGLIKTAVETDDWFKVDKVWRDDGSPSKHDTCIHGLPRYNGCAACLDDFLLQALTAKEGE
jgi:hypothetical protein